MPPPKIAGTAFKKSVSSSIGSHHDTRFRRNQNPVKEEKRCYKPAIVSTPSSKKKIVSTKVTTKCTNSPRSGATDIRKTSVTVDKKRKMPETSHVPSAKTARKEVSAEYAIKTISKPANSNNRTKPTKQSAVTGKERTFEVKNITSRKPVKQINQSKYSKNFKSEQQSLIKSTPRTGAIVVKNPITAKIVLAENTQSSVKNLEFKGSAPSNSVMLQEILTNTQTEKTLTDSSLVSENAIKENLEISNKPTSLPIKSNLDILCSMILSPEELHSNTVVPENLQVQQLDGSKTVDNELRTPIVINTNRQLSESTYDQPAEHCNKSDKLSPRLPKVTSLISQETSTGTQTNETKQDHEHDMVFDNVSGIVKESILLIPGIKYFTLNKLSLITGVISSQSGRRVTLSGPLMALLNSWMLLERVSKLFQCLANGPDFDHNYYADKLVDIAKTSSENQEGSFAKMNALLQHIEKAEETVEKFVGANSLLNIIDSVRNTIQTTGALDDKRKDQTIESEQDELDDVMSESEQNVTDNNQDTKIVYDIKQEPKSLDNAQGDASVTESMAAIFVCKECQRDCFSEVSLACHMAVSHPSKEGNICYICDKSCSTQTDLLIHIKQCHDVKQTTKAFRCSLCNKSFGKQRYLKTHLKRHSGIKNHECPICQWRFFERTKLKWHMETHKDARNRKLPYQCNVCSKSFYNRPSWSDHMNTHSGLKPFQCKLCEASFGHRMGLKRHELIHQKDYRYNCDYCGKGFKIASKLKEHVVRHTGLGNHRCEVCGKVYTTFSSLKRHNCCHNYSLSNADVNYTLLPEQGPVQEEEGHQYMCSECNALFNTLEDAEVHALTHSQHIDQEYKINLSDGSSRLVIVKQEIQGDVSTGTDCSEALKAVDGGGYVACEEDPNSSYEGEHNYSQS